MTGAAVRVGRAIAEHLAHAGYGVWVHHFESSEQAFELYTSMPWRSDGAAEEPARGGFLGPIRADLRQADERERLIETVCAATAPTGGRLDLLVNSAASFERGSFTQRCDADLDRVLALNLVAPLSLIRGCAPAMSPSGCVVNILDLGAHHPWRDRLDHCIAKAGLWHATRGLAVELAPLRVNAISPGTIAWPVGPDFTPGAPGRATVLARTPRGQIGSPQDVASAVAFLAQAPHITGQTLVLDGGRLAGIAGDHA